MPITFNAPQDPYGLRAGLSAFGTTFGEGLGKAQQKKTETVQKQKQGAQLGEALTFAFDVAKSPEQRLGALQQYMSSTGDTSVLPVFKQIGEEISAKSIIESPSRPGAAPTEEIVTRGEVSTPRGIERFSNEDLVKLQGSTNASVQRQAKAEIEKRKLTQKDFQSDREFEFKQAAPYLKKIDDQRESLSRERAALDWMKTSLANNDTGALSADNLASRFGLPELISPQGKLLLSAAKNELLGNIGALGGRPNQFIEKTFSESLQNLGNSTEANEVITLATEGNWEIKKARENITDRIRQEDKERFGGPQGDISARVTKELEPIEKRVSEKTALKMRQAIEKNKGERWMYKQYNKKVPTGTYLTKNMAKVMKDKHGTAAKAIENAKKLGYTIISPEEYEGLINE